MTGLSNPISVVAITALACFGLQANAQSYLYTAKTEKAVLKSGTVIASGLSWSCQGSACTISGPWPQPGLSACQTLAAQIGKITEYGHPGAKLSQAQLDQCNKTAASGVSTVVKVNPAVIDVKKTTLPDTVKKDPVIKPQVFETKPFRPTPTPTPTSSPTSTPTPVASGPEILIEEGSYQDYTLYVKAEGRMEFHGSYSGAYPSLSEEVLPVRWSGTTLRLPAFSHTGTDVAGEAVVSFGSSAPDGVYTTGSSGYFIEFPLQVSDIPQRVYSVSPTCTISAATVGTSSPYPAFPEEHQIGFAEGNFNRRAVVDGDWSINATVRMPIILRPMMEISDVHSISCQTRLMVTRLTGSGVDHVTMERAIDPTNPSFVTGFESAPGTSTVIRVRAVVEE